MKTLATRALATLLAVTITASAAPTARAAVPTAPPDASPLGLIPPRLSYLDGEVSFWRPGAQDWSPAEVNIPLAPGDELYTAHQGDLEMQIGTRAFVRAWGDTQVGLSNQDRDFLQFKVTNGHVSVDVRSLDPNQTVELDTPQAAFTIDRPGYYRVDVEPAQTSFITRRGGRATMTPAGGPSVVVTPSEEVVLAGAPNASVQAYVAPDLDVWDQWNYARTEELIDSMSARYVSSAVYGVDDLDHYGNWRVVPTYGSVWVPNAVPAGWAPYSTGRWIWDRHYGWTWVDAAPWGWAPYHYGRWVSIDGLWAWAPGPIVVRPAYAPALVAFFGAPGVAVAANAPLLSWVALGWGEPVVPWWGSSRFVGRPSWVGWGGPRVVNNVVVNRTTVVDVKTVTVYRNVGVQNAVVAVRADHFGRQPVREARVVEVDTQRLQPVHGAVRTRPDAASFVAGSGPAARPPEAALDRRVVATRPPARTTVASPPSVVAAPAQATAPVARREPAPRIVAAPTPAPVASVPPRPPFGASQTERVRPASPHARVEPAPGRPNDAVATRSLPGEPANRLAPHRAAETPRGAPAGHARPPHAPERDQRGR
ncbi:MAG: hypothetical protein AUH18_06500 [Candidatus Rokubacteria bacterium 13_2_20CM_69_10]|nr:MAG: hypothetical protein AUH18_06500 [Candidatus Rokubacteria bacterium 13_2_20CM_69_10]